MIFSKGNNTSHGGDMDTNIGELIRFYRKRAKLTQGELGKGICSAKYIGLIEKGVNIPTLYVVNRISERLKVNIYYAYGYAYKYNNIETYGIALDINEALNRKNYRQLEKYLDLYKDSYDFQEGEALLLLTYVEVILQTRKGNCTEVIKLIEEKFPECKTDCFDEDKDMPGVEQALILSYAVNKRKIGETEFAKKVFISQINRLTKLLNINYYDDEGKKKPWIAMLANCVLNLYYTEDELNENLDTIIMNAIEVNKRENRAMFLSELLLCHTTYLLSKGNIEEAKKQFHLAECFFTFYSEGRSFAEVSKRTINRFSDVTMLM